MELLAVLSVLTCEPVRIAKQLQCTLTMSLASLIGEDRRPLSRALAQKCYERVLLFMSLPVFTPVS
jgi:hypothetical protein